MRRAASLHEWSSTIVADHFLRDPSERSIAAALAKHGALAMRELRDGLEVEATSFVGRVQLGNLTITVTPKIGGPLLLELIRYAYGLRDLRIIGEADFGTGALLEDLLVAQLHHEASELLARGISRRYVRTAETLLSPRGRIDLQRLAASGGIATAGLPCVHHPRSTDFILNRVTLAGLRHAAPRSARHARCQPGRARLANGEHLQRARGDGPVDGGFALGSPSHTRRSRTSGRRSHPLDHDVRHSVEWWQRR